MDRLLPILFICCSLNWHLFPHLASLSHHVWYFISFITNIGQEIISRHFWHLISFITAIFQTLISCHFWYITSFITAIGRSFISFYFWHRSLATFGMSFVLLPSSVDNLSCTIVGIQMTPPPE